MIYLPRVSRGPEQKSIRRQHCLDALAEHVRESRDLLKDVLVGEVPPSLSKRHDLLPQLLKTENRKLPAKRVADNLAAASAEGVGHFAELPVEIVIEPNSYG